MAKQPLLEGRKRYFDSNGEPLAGGLVYTYVANTNIPLQTWLDAEGITPNTNPIILDASGECSIFIGNGTYKIIVTDADGATIRTEEPVRSLTLTGGEAEGAAESAAEAGVYAQQAEDARDAALAAKTGAETALASTSDLVDDLPQLIEDGIASATNTFGPRLGTAETNISNLQSALGSPSSANVAGEIVKRTGAGYVYATLFNGDLVGNVTGNVTGTSANVTGVVAKANGGTGVDNSSVTFPSTGTITTLNSTDILTNKTLIDSSLAIADATDNTKKILFDAAGTTGTNTTLLSSQTANRILTLPNVTDSLVARTTTDTLTNKTLTSPTINTPNYNGGTASNTSRFIMHNAAKATLTGLTRAAGALVYATDESKPYFDTGAALVPFQIGALGALSVVSKTAAYTATTSDDVIKVDATTAAFTVTLPTAVGNTGKLLRFVKTDTSINLVTIDANASETINGQLVLTLGGQYCELEIVSDGAGWIVLNSKGNPRGRYLSLSGQTIGNAGEVRIDFATKDRDSHNLVTTGATWAITADRAGTIAIKATVKYQAFLHPTGGTLYAGIGKGGVGTVSYGANVLGNGQTLNWACHVSDEIEVAKDDTLYVVTFQNSGATRALIADGPSCHVTFSYLS